MSKTFWSALVGQCRWFSYVSAAVLGVVAGLSIYLIGHSTASIVDGMTRSFAIALVGPSVATTLSLALDRSNRRSSVPDRLVNALISATVVAGFSLARGDLNVVLSVVTFFGAFGVGNLLAEIWSRRLRSANTSQGSRRSWWYYSVVIAMALGALLLVGA